MSRMLEFRTRTIAFAAGGAILFLAGFGYGYSTRCAEPGDFDARFPFGEHAPANF